MHKRSNILTLTRDPFIVGDVLGAGKEGRRLAPGLEVGVSCLQCLHQVLKIRQITVRRRLCHTEKQSF